MKYFESSTNLVAICVALFSLIGINESTAVAQKPNIILINLDDANQELFSEENLSTRFPHLNQLAQRSVNFTNAHATTPLCGPSRACLLRAQYAHHCGIKINVPGVPNAFGFTGGMQNYLDRGYTSDDLSTWMQDAGYHTIQVGKFLHATVPVIPEGWDDFYSSSGARYFSTHRITNRNGHAQAETIPEGVYRTVAEADDAVELINRRADADDKPFFMYLNPFGPHSQEYADGEPVGEMFEDRYADLWPDAELPVTESYNEADMDDRVGPFQNLPQLTVENEIRLNFHYRERLLAMKSVDDMVGRVINTLENRGLADNTYVFVTSDNGFSMGEQRISAKSLHMNAATNVPLMVAGPGVEQATTDHLLAHIDIGPTIVELAGGWVPDFVDGVSFAPLLATPNRSDGVRESVLIENFQTRASNGEVRQFSSTGLRLKNESYVEWADGGREIFDLASDPLELRNIYGLTPLNERQLLASWLRMSKAYAPSNASFHRPYYDLDELDRPWTFEGIAEATISTRSVKLAIRDLSTYNYWDGSNWIPEYVQVDAELSQPNGMLTTWRYQLDLDWDQIPTGPLKAWVWGHDYSSEFDTPDDVEFSLREPIRGDVNKDGDSNFDDIIPFIALLSTGGFSLEADFDENGWVNFDDIGHFIALLVSGG